MATVYNEVRNKNLKTLVDLNDLLISLLNESDSIKFPKIVICGDQSHGKTSTIENIIGFNLPRGEGTQTRCPFMIKMRPHSKLSLRLRYTKKDGAAVDKDVEQDKLEAEMRQAQNDVTGDDRSLSPSIITLEIFKPDLDTLTLIDLPGMIHFNERVDEVEKVKENLTTMYNEFLQEEDTTICCVVNAAVDINTSLSFALARQHDRLGDRTILCVTKVDQRPDTSFDGFLAGARNNNINHIYFIKNRTQTEVNNKISFEETRLIEKKLFADNIHLQNIPDKYKGLRSMCKCLIDLQEKTITPNLIKNYEKLISLLARKKRHLKDLSVGLINKKQILIYLKKKIDVIRDMVSNQYHEVYDKVENKEFYEKYHTKEENGEFFNIDFYNVGLKMSYVFGKDDSEKKFGLTISAQKDCQLYVEIQTKSKIHSSFNLNLKKNKNEHLPISDEDFKIKIVLEEELLFFEYHKKKIEYYESMKNCYDLNYFISDIFKDLYLNELKFPKQHFGLVDRDLKHFAEKLLKKYYLMSVRKSTKNFINFSKEFCINIWLDNYERIFNTYPLLVAKIRRVIENFFEPKYKKLKMSIKTDFYSVGFLNTLDPSYLLRIMVIKDMILNNKNVEENIYALSFLKNIDFEKIKEVYQSDEELFYQALRIWSFWELACSRVIDCTVNKIPLILIHEPIKELRDQIWEMIYDLKEKELQNIVNSKSIIEQRNSLRVEIEQLTETIAKIKTSLIESQTLDLDGHVDESEEEEGVDLNEEQSL